MAETKRVIDIKKKKLARELSKNNPDKNIVRRLRESINRHKIFELRNKKSKLKREKKWVN